MNTTSILVFIFIVLIIYISLIPYSSAYHKQCIYESFGNTYSTAKAPIAWSAFNKLAKRALMFQPPHGKSLASQRAETENNLVFDPSANCTTLSIPNNINNQAQSLVSENSILYKLTSSCFSFKTKKLQDGALKLVINSPQDWYKYVYMMLLNPLFIEINKDNFTTTSHGYFLQSRTPVPITNKGHGDFLTGTDYKKGNSLLNTIRLTEDSLFNYANDKSNVYNYISQLNIGNNNTINVKAFYTRPYDSSQSVGTKITFNKNNNNNGKYTVSQMNYQDLPDREENAVVKMFSKTIDKYFNGITLTEYPTFTTTFKLNMFNQSQNQISQGNGVPIHMAFEMYMNNTLGMNVDCNSTITYSPEFAKNGNILSMAVGYPRVVDTKKPAIMNITLGTSRGGCLFKDKNDVVAVAIPCFEKVNTEATCIVTISPYTIDFLAYWVNPNTANKQDNVEFIYQQKLLEKGNDFENLFVNTKSSQNKFADININTNKTFVPSVQEVQLGYKNMAEILYNAIHLGQ
jgi:hypothetical protein